MKKKYHNKFQKISPKKRPRSRKNRKSSVPSTPKKSSISPIKNLKNKEHLKTSTINSENHKFLLPKNTSSKDLKKNFKIMSSSIKNKKKFPRKNFVHENQSLVFPKKSSEDKEKGKLKKLNHNKSDFGVYPNKKNSKDERRSKNNHNNLVFLRQEKYNRNLKIHYSKGKKSEKNSKEKESKNFIINIFF